MRPLVSFSVALEALKRGERITRFGWNGRGMWLAFSPGAEAVGASQFWSQPNAAYARSLGGLATVLPSITMRTASGEILMGWVASASDLLADDWMVLNEGDPW